MSDRALVRWRLILGEASQRALSEAGGGAPGGIGDLAGDDLACDTALSWLYDRDPSLADRDIDDKRGGLGAPRLDVPKWLDEVHRLFPRETIERLEQDAAERYQIHEVVTNPAVLARVEPNETLLRAVLRTKHLMNPEVLAMARELIAKVVKKLVGELGVVVRRRFSAARGRRRSPIKLSRNLDARATIRHNLDTWDPQKKRLVLQEPLFSSLPRRHCERWQVIVLVDQSDSMLSSVIHAAVTAACLFGLPGVRARLAVFSSDVVDLTDRVTDPVEVLMKVQLGGGTDIGKAVTYAAGLVEAPRRTIVVLVTDFYEGGRPEALISRVRSLCDQGTIVLGLAALDRDACPVYNKDLARRLVAVGAHVGAMTPGELVGFIAEKVRA